MIETIKNQIWQVLKNIEVSLVMLYHEDGSIVWHKGREIEGNSIKDGQGFCKTYINESLQKNEEIFKHNGVIYSSSKTLSGSAIRLLVKAVCIQPLDNSYFLYIDSGTKKNFSEKEIFSIKTLGELLSASIQNIKLSENTADGIAGISEVAKEIKKKVLKFSFEEAPVLLLGETGVGKNHIANLIHKYSGRKGKLITVHLPTLTDGLFESELFGYKKGAFTGADNDKKGLIDEAQDGTLFFDEVSEVPVLQQAKLLRFVETLKYNRLGDSKELTGNVRIIAASNRDLKKEIKKGTFREDLYYRLSILEILIPPLRDRVEDILMLFEEKKNLLKNKKIDDGFMDVLKDYSWPGNIREFITVLTRVGIQCDGLITSDELKKIINQDEVRSESNNKGNDFLEEKLQIIINKIKNGENFWDIVKEPFLKRILNIEEVQKILAVFLKENNEVYSEILEPLNIKKKEYKKFIGFLYKNKIKEK